MERYELPNLGALNFLLHEALGGGGTLSLRIDAQGKTLGAALLRMEIEAAEDELAELRRFFHAVRSKKRCVEVSCDKIRIAHDALV